MIEPSVILERVHALEGFNVSRILEFIADMKQAETTAYYNDARRTTFLSLNLLDIYPLITRSRTAEVRHSIITSRLLNIPTVIRENTNDYF